MYRTPLQRFFKPFIFTFAFFVSSACHVIGGITEELLVRNLDLSGYTQVQQGIILAETRAYAKAIEPLYYTDNEAWKQKVNEMLYKIRDGFRIYKLSRDPKIEAAVRSFDSTAQAKVYLLSYVEDAFLNNIFLRLAEAYYESTRPEQYIIFRYSYIKSPSSTIENPLYIPSSPLIEIAKPLEARLKIALSELAATCYNLIKPSDASGENILSDASNERFYSSVSGGLESLLSGMSPHCDCWREGWIRAAATFEDHLDDLGAKGVYYIQEGVVIKVGGRLPAGEEFVLIEKVFEKGEDIEAYTQFLINWEVDAFDARIIQTTGWDDCCKRIIGRMEENMRRTTPWAPALLAEIILAHPERLTGGTPAPTGVQEKSWKHGNRYWEFWM